MRMWNVPPALLCRQHLLGEHLEMHMFVGSIRRGVSMMGYLDGGLLETALLQQRHDALVIEMKKRGYSHRSPMTYRDTLARGRVDTVASLAELFKRCEHCRALQRESMHSEGGYQHG